MDPGHDLPGDHDPMRAAIERARQLFYKYVEPEGIAAEDCLDGLIETMFTPEILNSRRALYLRSALAVHRRTGGCD